MIQLKGQSDGKYIENTLHVFSRLLTLCVVGNISRLLVRWLVDWLECCRVCFIVRDVAGS